MAFVDKLCYPVNMLSVKTGCDNLVSSVWNRFALLASLLTNHGHFLPVRERCTTVVQGYVCCIHVRYGTASCDKNVFTNIWCQTERLAILCGTEKHWE